MIRHLVTTKEFLHLKTQMVS